jgi:hypothetical protein
MGFAETERKPAGQGSCCAAGAGYFFETAAWMAVIARNMGVGMGRAAD